MIVLVYDFNLDRSFHFADIGGDSEQPEVLAERIEAILLLSPQQVQN